MISRSIFALLFFITTAVGASAGGVTAYTADVFAKALASGKPVVVHVHADWCPVCIKQQSTLNSLSKDAAFSKAKFIQVDFDMDRDFLKAHKVPSQSAIIVFKNGKEVARLNGVTDPATIQAKVKAAAG